MFEDEEFDLDLSVECAKSKTKTGKNEKKPKRRFPGPAGLLNPGVPDLQCSQENADLNTVWIKALDDLGVQWGDPDSLVSKYNVGHIKQNAKPGSSIRMPILVVRIKNLDRSCRDNICCLRDPHGEVGGSIHRDVVEQFEAEIQVGSILVLRNVVVLMTTKSQYVNITVNNLVSIYRLDKVTYIHSVNLKDMKLVVGQLEKVRQEQYQEIQKSLVTSAQPTAWPQLPAFSVPGPYAPPTFSVMGQHAGSQMMQDRVSSVTFSGSSNDGFRLPLAPQQSANKFVFRRKASGASKPLDSSKPLADVTNIVRTNQMQESFSNSSQVVQKINESIRTPQSQASSIPESQNSIASMMEGLNSDLFFGDF